MTEAEYKIGADIKHKTGVNRQQLSDLAYFLEEISKANNLESLHLDGLPEFSIGEIIKQLRFNSEEITRKMADFG